VCLPGSWFYSVAIEHLLLMWSSVFTRLRVLPSNHLVEHLLLLWSSVFTILRVLPCWPVEHQLFMSSNVFSSPRVVPFHCPIEHQLLMWSSMFSRPMVVPCHCPTEQWYSTFFPPIPLETLFHSTLYPQSCWCIIQVIHNYI
jgi:hypothetical protein